MAFIRELAALDDAGDMRHAFRRFKKHLNIHRLRGIAGYLPGPAGSIAGALGLGDPAPRRKHAGSGPHAKSQQHTKNVHSSHPAAHSSKGKKKKGHGGGITGHDVAEILKNNAGEAIGGARDVIAAFQQGGPGGALGRMAQGQPHRDPGSYLDHSGGGHRRHTNPANVKALRRSLRRVEAFERLVASVQRAYPRLMPKHRHTHHSRGHKRGCKCVACRAR